MFNVDDEQLHNTRDGEYPGHHLKINHPVPEGHWSDLETFNVAPTPITEKEQEDADALAAETGEVAE